MLRPKLRQTAICSGLPTTVDMVARRPSSNHRSVPCDKPVRRQPAADARGLSRLPGAPVARNAGAERELTMMRWGMPPPPRTGGPPVTNIRNTASPHWPLFAFGGIGTEFRGDRGYQVKADPRLISARSARVDRTDPCCSLTPRRS